MGQEPGIPVWKGLFDWSIQFQDGTHPSNFSPEEFTPERRAWLESALKHYMADFVDRMTQIKATLDQAAAGRAEGLTATAGADADAPQAAPAHTLEEQEALLDELVDIVSSIDYARDLHKIGGLPTLLELLQSPAASLRSRAAEVLATCMANNPPVQQWFLEGGVLSPLLSLLGNDGSAVVRAKALLALSAMVRHSQPCLDAFKTAGGLTLLVAAVSSQSDVRLVRKALFLLQYVLASCPADAAAACRLGALPAIAGVLHDFEQDGRDAAGGGGGSSSGGDGGGGTDLRQAVLSVLTEIASTAEGWRDVRTFAGPSPDTAPSPSEHDGAQAPSEGRASTRSDASFGSSYFAQAAQRLLARHQALAADEQEAQREEEALCSHLLRLLSASSPPPPAPAGRPAPAAAASAQAALAAAAPPAAAAQPMLMLGAP